MWSISTIKPKGIILPYCGHLLKNVILKGFIATLFIRKYVGIYMIHVLVWVGHNQARPLSYVVNLNKKPRDRNNNSFITDEKLWFLWPNRKYSCELELILSHASGLLVVGCTGK